MRPERVVFWQSSLSLHQAALIAAVADRVKETVLVSSDDVLTARREMGWRVPDFGRATVHVAPAASTIRTLGSEDGSSTVHIFEGWKRLPFATDSLKAVKAGGGRVALYAEIPNLKRYPKAKLLRDHVKYLFMGRTFDFVLAVGRTSADWYTRIGFPAVKVFPFGYFVDRRTWSEGVTINRDDAFHICFVGQLVDGKGVDVLIDAFARIAKRNWRCDIVGDGPRKHELAAQARKLSLDDRIAFLGRKKNDDAVAAIGASDLLILPSRSKDGWGVVVNEALVHGVPAICTDRCGAQDLLDGSERGEVVQAGSRGALARAIEKRIALGRSSHQQRRRIAHWAECISGDSAARHLIGILDHVYSGGERPVPPWAGA